MAGGRGNYSAYGLADLLAGTSVGADMMDDFEDQAERKDIGAKARKMGSRAKGKGNGIARRLRDMDKK